MLARPRRALIVTDVNLLRWALSSAFGQAGFVALAAQSADAAVDTLRTVNDIDLVVISLSIGPVAGEIVRSCTNEWPGMSVLLLAADPDTDPSERQEGTVLLELPFSVDDVIAKAEELVPAHSDQFGPDDDAPLPDVVRA